MGREIVQFIKIGRYFETKTFEWAKIYQENDRFVFELVRGLDYEYGVFPSMKEFVIVEEMDDEKVSESFETLEDCLEWGENNHNCAKDKWSLDVIEIYNEFVKKGELGQGGEFE